MQLNSNYQLSHNLVTQNYSFNFGFQKFILNKKTPNNFFKKQFFSNCNNSNVLQNNKFSYLNSNLNKNQRIPKISNLSLNHQLMLMEKKELNDTCFNKSLSLNTKYFLNYQIDCQCKLDHLNSLEKTLLPSFRSLPSFLTEGRERKEGREKKNSKFFLLTIILKKLITRKKKNNTIQNYSKIKLCLWVQLLKKFNKKHIAVNYFANNNYLLLNLIKKSQNFPSSLVFLYINLHSRFWNFFSFFSDEIKLVSILNEIMSLKYSNKLKKKHLKLSLVKSLLFLPKQHNMINITSKIIMTSEFNTFFINYPAFKLELSNFQWFFKNAVLHNAFNCNLQLVALELKNVTRKTQTIKTIEKLNQNAFYFLFTEQISENKKFGFSPKTLSKFENNSQFLTRLNQSLWRINKKRHNQNALEWIFQKYWLTLNFYRQQYFFLYVKPNKFQSNLLRKEFNKKFFNSKKIITFKNTLKPINLLAQQKHDQVLIKKFLSLIKIKQNKFEFTQKKRIIQISQTQQFYTALKTQIVANRLKKEHEFNLNSNYIKSKKFFYGRKFINLLTFNIVLKEITSTKLLVRQYNCVTYYLYW